MNNISGKTSLTLNNISGTSSIGGSFKVSDLANQDVTVNSLTANSINSLTVSNIDSISVKDSSILLNQGSTTDANNTGIFMQHSAAKFSGIVKEKDSGLFKLVDLSALPSSLTSTFTLTQAAGLTVSDLVSSGSVKFTNSNGYSTNVKASSSQTADVNLTLPSSAPGNQQVLSVAATGALSWTNKADIGPQILTVNTNSNSGSKAIAFQNDTNNFSAMTSDFMFLKNMTNSNYSTVNSSSIPANYASITCNDVNVGNAGNVNFINTASKKTSIGPNPTQNTDIKLMLPPSAPGNNTFLASAGTSGGVTSLQWITPPSPDLTNISNSTVTTGTLAADVFSTNTASIGASSQATPTRLYLYLNESVNGGNQITARASPGSSGFCFSNTVQFETDRYFNADPPTRFNAAFQFGLRQSPTTWSGDTMTNYNDFFYIGRGGITANDFIVTRQGKVGCAMPNSVLPNYSLEIGRPSATTSEPNYGDDKVNAAKPSSSSWVISCDQRVKSNIVDADLDICYNNVKNIKLRRFAYNKKYIPTGDTNQLGFVADEIQPIFPKAVQIVDVKKFHVGDNEDGSPIIEEMENFKHLDDSQIANCSFGALQKTISLVESLQSRLASQDDKLSRLESHNLDLLTRLQALELKTYNL